MPHRGVKVCELVLFMLMPERRCEDHHVDMRPLVTILRHTSFPEDRNYLVQPVHGHCYDLQRRL